MHRFALLFVVTMACGGSKAPPSAATPAPSNHAQASGSAVDAMPIAQYLGMDDATGARVAELLSAAGIASSAGGSRGYSVWLDGGDRVRARQILADAIARECLAVTLFDDQGQVIQSVRPARCNPAPAPSPAPSSPSPK